MNKHTDAHLHLRACQPGAARTRGLTLALLGLTLPLTACPGDDSTTSANTDTITTGTGSTTAGETSESESTDTDVGTTASSSGTDSSGTGTDTASNTDTATSDTTDTTETLTDTGTDSGTETDTGTGAECMAADEGEQIADCVDEAPPGAFSVDLQWSWDGPDGEVHSLVTPLVAQLTDDNDDGAIDLCDTPDIVVIASAGLGQELPAHLHVLDGATGALHATFDTELSNSVGPALADIDGDGIVEIIASRVGGAAVAFEHDGAVKWETSPDPMMRGGNFGIADVDNDGDVEIYGGSRLLDHTGAIVWETDAPFGDYHAVVAADLDGDDDQELILGNLSLHHDGSTYLEVDLPYPGFPQVANLDDDPEPEVLLMTPQGINLYDHDGTIQYQELRPTGDPAEFVYWYRPATIHDFDGDGQAEFAVSSRNHYAAYEGDATLMWVSDVSDESGISSGTAFDFLGDGVAEAIYADEYNLFVYNGMNGNLELGANHTSVTLAEYPVVADVDNDGSAEIVVVSTGPYDRNIPRTPTVLVYRDIEERWIQARRIWNQHTYHVTNVNEDGTIPQFETPSWKYLNTYRTNAQIEGGSVCMPVPE